VDWVKRGLKGARIIGQIDGMRSLPAKSARFPSPSMKTVWKDTLAAGKTGSL